MGLPPLQPPGGALDRNTRFYTLNERLADHVHAATPRVTPGRGTRTSIGWDYPQTLESGDNEPTDDESLGPPPRPPTPVDVPTPHTSTIAASENATDGVGVYPTVVDHIGGSSPADPHQEFPTAAGFEWELFLEGLGGENSSIDSTAIPAPIRDLFVAHAKKADSAIADFQQELRHGKSRQDDLTAEV